MNIAATGAELRQLLGPARGRGRIAFVPTMGCLHEGHASLIRKARELADVVVVSIYVNPLQFGPNEDLDRYPRTFQADEALCEAENADIIFHPARLYPADGPKVTLKVAELADVLCGANRPGHFDGVVTVVNLLFNIVQPDLAIFGEKDWQQLAIIRRMVNDLQMPVEIVPGATVREAGGLAMSSRNRYLSDADRQRALAISQALLAMRDAAGAGETDCAVLLADGRNRLAQAGIEPEYLEIRHAETLAELSSLDRQLPARAFIAAKIGSARLIDNIPLSPTEEQK